ncbi:hypothetical protein SUDANB121_05920 (plasmid) [Nocardiopsis dassonvillei]|uniref:hypothetical protein n=1 Tax=Nocardiopsis dassonvillei TaxID=2014 RepID=UPI003F5432BE
MSFNTKTETPPGSGPHPQTASRVTVNLTKRSTQALAEAVEATGETRTDVINRALQVYAYLEEAFGRGDRLYIENSEGTRERLRFF